MVKYKTFRIVNKKKSDKFIQFNLDDCLKFDNGEKRFIFCVNCSPFNSYEEGDFLKIDLEIVSYKHSNHDFNNTNIVGKVSSSSSTNIITTGGYSSDIVVSPSAVNAMNSPNAMELARRMSEMVDATGKEYEFKIEDPNSKLNYSLICRKNN